MNRGLAETILFSIPEAIVIVLLASSIIEQKFNWSRLVIMGVIFGSASHFIRQITGDYILNIIISTLVLICIIKLFRPYAIFEAVTAGLIAVSLYLAVEFLNVKTMQMLTGIDPIQMEQDFLLRILWFLPQIAGGIVLAWLIRYFIFRQSPIFTEIKGINYEDKHL